MRYKQKIRRRTSRKATKLLSLSLVLTTIGGILIYKGNGFPERMKEDLEFTELLNDTHKFPEANNCDAETSAKLDYQYDLCHKIGSKHPRYILVGDSHAGHFYKGLSSYGPSGLIVWTGGCPPLGKFKIREDKHCGDRWKKLSTAIRKNFPETKTILFSFYAENYFTSSLSSGEKSPDYFKILNEIRSSSHSTSEKISGSEIQTEFLDTLSQSIESFLGNGYKLGLIAGTPDFKFEPRTCIERQRKIFTNSKHKVNPEKCQIARNLIETRSMASDQILQEIGARYPTVNIFKPRDVLCTTESCGMFVEQSPIYWDSNHLNKKGSELIGKPLAAWVSNILESSQL